MNINDSDMVVMSLDDFKEMKERLKPKPKSSYLKPVVEYTKEGVFAGTY